MNKQQVEYFSLAWGKQEVQASKFRDKLSEKQCIQTEQLTSPLKWMLSKSDLLYD